MGLVHSARRSLGHLGSLLHLRSRSSWCSVFLHVQPNDQLVHELLLQGGDFLDAWGLSADDGTNAEAEAGNPFLAVAKQVRSVAERAFYDVLGSGLSLDPPQVERIVVLIEDARDTLKGLIPDSPTEEGALVQHELRMRSFTYRRPLFHASSSGRALRAALSEKLEGSYLRQRLLPPPLGDGPADGFDFGYLRQARQDKGFVRKIRGWYQTTPIRWPRCLTSWPR